MVRTQTLPPVIDLHLNGVTLPPRESFSAPGVINFSAEDLSLAQVRSATEELARKGTTHFLATVVSSPEATTLRNLEILAAAMEQPWGAPILGVHVEGPFFSRETRGAHPESLMREKGDMGLFSRMFEASKGNVVLTTVSPALKDATEFIRSITTMGVVVSLGHHNATVKQIEDAFNAGARGVTHAGNGWSKEPPADARKNMEVIAQLVDERGYVMIIPDGVHVPSDFIRLTHKVVEAVKPGRVIWVSDASPLSGAPQGDYTFCGEPARVDVDEDNRLRTFPLTGSYEQLAQCLTILRGMKIVSEADIRAGVTTNPLALVEPALKRINRFPDLGTVG